MSSESIPVGLRSLLGKLYFLAQIKAGEKPCMSNMTIVDGDTWTGAFYRFFKGEDRKTCLTVIENIVSQAIDSISVHERKKSFLALVVNALAEARVGVESMLTTYRDDAETKGKIQVQLTNIDIQLDKYRSLIKGYRPEDNNEYYDSSRNNKNKNDVDSNDGIKNTYLKTSTEGMLDNKNSRRRRKLKRSVNLSNE